VGTAVVSYEKKGEVYESTKNLKKWEGKAFQGKIPPLQRKEKGCLLEKKKKKPSKLPQQVSGERFLPRTARKKRGGCEKCGHLQGPQKGKGTPRVNKNLGGWEPTIASRNSGRCRGTKEGRCAQRGMTTGKSERGNKWSKDKEKSPAAQERSIIPRKKKGRDRESGFGAENPLTGKGSGLRKGKGGAMPQGGGGERVSAGKGRLEE